MAMKLSEQAKWEETTDGVTESGSQSSKIFKSFDYGITLGGQLSVKMGQVFLIMDARYSLGLTNMAKEPDATTIKVNPFSLIVGIGV